MSETVRCKMRVTRVASVAMEAGKDTGYEITLQPVYDGSPENKEFYKWTPGGQLHLQTINAGAAKMFKDFGDFYIDITRAPAP